MTSSIIDIGSARIQDVSVTDDELQIRLTDGRTVSAPLAWYPRLQHASPAERSNWRMIGGGEGIHWPAVDEDISVANVLAGKPSGESQASFAKWLASRTTR